MDCRSQRNICQIVQKKYKLFLWIADLREIYAKLFRKKYKLFLWIADLREIYAKLFTNVYLRCAGNGSRRNIMTKFVYLRCAGNGSRRDGIGLPAKRIAGSTAAGERWSAVGGAGEQRCDLDFLRRARRNNSDGKGDGERGVGMENLGKSFCRAHLYTGFIYTTGWNRRTAVLRQTSPSVSPWTANKQMEGTLSQNPSSSDVFYSARLMGRMTMSNVETQLPCFQGTLETLILVDKLI
jgi:hypothetical protein